MNAHSLRKQINRRNNCFRLESATNCCYLACKRRKNCSPWIFEYWNVQKFKQESSQAEKWRNYLWLPRVPHYNADPKLRKKFRQLKAWTEMKTLVWLIWFPRESFKIAFKRGSTTRRHAIPLFIFMNGTPDDISKRRADGEFLSTSPTYFSTK